MPVDPWTALAIRVSQLGSWRAQVESEKAFQRSLALAKVAIEEKDRVWKMSLREQLDWANQHEHDGNEVLRDFARALLRGWEEGSPASQV